MSNMSENRAIEDLSAIRETIEKVSGSEIFHEFIRRSSIVLIKIGVITCIAISGTWFVAESNNSFKWQGITGIWIVATLFAGIVKINFFKKLSSERNLKLVEYLKKVLSKSFLGVDLPIEIGGIILMIYFAISGQVPVLLPLFTLLIGMVLANLGSVFSSKGLKVVGYISLFFAAIGFLCPCINLYFYSFVVFGLFWTLWGVALNIMNRKGQENGAR